MNLSRQDFFLNRNGTGDGLLLRRRSVKSNYSLLALVQYARVQARRINAVPFDSNKVREQLQNIRALSLHCEMDFEKPLSELLKCCRAILVYLPALSGAFLNGASFFDNNINKVVIGITMRGKYVDKFWFSLFHEIGHVLDGHIYQRNGISAQDEKEADRFVLEVLIPTEEIVSFYKEHDTSISAIQAFARRIGVSEGIVIGRMQHDGIIPQSQYNQYKWKYDSAV